MMNTVLIGMGTALPAGSLTQSEAATSADRLRKFDSGPTGDRKAQLLSVLYRRSGVRTRHSVLLRAGDDDPYDRQTFYTLASDASDLGPSTSARMQRFDEDASELAKQSCQQALADAAVDVADVKHLVTVSCSGFAAPGFDLSLYPALGLRADVSRTHVGFMGCHGALNGLRVARALSIAHPGQTVLVCATELCTLHHQYTDDPQQIVANSLFADGSAAVVVRTTSGDDNGIAPGGRWTLQAQSSCLLDNSADMMTWRIGDHGFQMTLSAQVPELIRQRLKPWLRQWLASEGISLDEVTNWAVHPGGPRILSATAEALDLEPSQLEVSSSVLAEYGNMSSPTILFILKRMLSQRAGPCVALAFGPGLVVEAAILR